MCVKENEKFAYFAGGCFWCITPVFRDLDGVTEVVSGYSGGDEANPAYADVKAQRTGHRETIRIRYDASVVSFAALLDVFLENVDPFDGEGQFIDRGHSYTLAVYGSPEERETAKAKIETLSEKSGRPVLVSVEPFKAFYLAEDYHQDYDLKNPEAFAEEWEASGRNGRKR